MMNSGRKMGNLLHGMKPVIMMITVQITFAGVNVFYKLAAADKFNLRVLVVYRFIFSAAFIVPVALYIERNKRPAMTWTLLFQGFLCGLFGGALYHNFYAEVLALTSATFAAASTNLIPAFTFIMALLFRLEKLGWRTAAGKAKVVGTLMGIGGAMLLTFYHGLDLNPWKSPVDLLTLVDHGNQHAAQSQHHSANMGLGAVFGLCSVISFSLWLIIQAKMAETCPCPYTNTALMSVMASLQAIVFALATVRDWDQWKLGWNIRLYTVVYSGSLASGVMYTFIAWCVQMRGPLFVSVFNPLMLLLVAIVGSLLLEEQLHLGSVLGAVLIICGLYVVLWGKGKEMKKMLQLVPEEALSIPPEEELRESKRVHTTPEEELRESKRVHTTPEEELRESKRVEIYEISPFVENADAATLDRSLHISISEDETTAKDVCVNIIKD